MSIFEYDDYKKWTNYTITTMAKGGRGQYRKIAEFLNTSPTIVTQVFNGDRELTSEQSVLLADYFALSKIESRFLIILVNYSRAGTHRYKQILKDEIEELREKSREIKNRVQQNAAMTEEVKSVLYSNWYYLAIWSLTAIKEFNNLEAIIDRLKLNRKKAREALDFLIKYSFVIEKDDKLQVGPTLIHLEAQSSHIPRQHQNWRLQAFRKYEDQVLTNVSYTAPVTLSEKDAEILRERIRQFISESVNLIKDSPSEKLYCLCLDWFEV